MSTAPSHPKGNEFPDSLRRVVSLLKPRITAQGASILDCSPPLIPFVNAVRNFDDPKAPSLSTLDEEDAETVDPPNALAVKSDNSIEDGFARLDQLLQYVDEGVLKISHQYAALGPVISPKIFLALENLNKQAKNLRSIQAGREANKVAGSASQSRRDSGNHSRQPSPVRFISIFSPDGGRELLFVSSATPPSSIYIITRMKTSLFSDPKDKRDTDSSSSEDSQDGDGMEDNFDDDDDNFSEEEFEILGNGKDQTNGAKVSQTLFESPVIKVEDDDDVEQTKDPFENVSFYFLRDP